MHPDAEALVSVLAAARRRNARRLAELGFVPDPADLEGTQARALTALAADRLEHRRHASESMAARQEELAADLYALRAVTPQAAEPWQAERLNGKEIR